MAKEQSVEIRGDEETWEGGDRGGCGDIGGWR